MSKHINVNPNFYKVGGREHAEGHGEAIPYDRQKAVLNTAANAKRVPMGKSSKKK